MGRVSKCIAGLVAGAENVPDTGVQISGPGLAVVIIALALCGVVIAIVNGRSKRK